MSSNVSTLVSMDRNVSNASAGLTEVFDDEYYISQIRDWFVLCLYFISFILAIIGNVFVCLVIYKKKNLRSTTYKLVLNMAISDIIGGLVIPSQWVFCSTYVLDSGMFGQRLCGTLKSFQILSYYVSTFSMTMIAIDRYRLICKPLSNRMTWIIPTIITWVLGIAFTSTTLISMRISEYFSPKGLISCRVVFKSSGAHLLRAMRVMLVIITQYLLPFLLTGYFYGMVVHTVWRREKIGSVSEEKKKSLNKNKKKTIKMLITVTVLFGLAWFPVHLMHFFKFYTNVIPVTPGTCNSSTFYMLCYWLAISSCFYNPFIYCYFNNDFKSEAILYLKCLIPCLKINNQFENSEESTGTNQTASTDQASTHV